MDKLVERLDTQTKRVLIETKILETTLNPKSAKGVDWTGVGQAECFALGIMLCTGSRWNSADDRVGCKW